jgi:exopolyphosphatase/guanosine-5'-triphosphate,3'-diphosphate pyrophosphatase
MANVAAVDCGSLSTRLLVCGPAGEPLVRLMRITRLGEGVDRSRSLSAGAIERVITVLGEYRQVMDGHGVQRARMVGTSALRDAGNRDLFCTEAARVIGVELELLTGAEEAALSFLGATRELPPDHGPWLVADIGGGSTELAVGPGPAGAVARLQRAEPGVGPGPAGACSLDLGCVRVTERFLQHDPPAPAELVAAAEWLSEQYRQAEEMVPGLASARTLVGLAGTVAALASYDQGLAVYNRDAVHHYRLTRPAVERAVHDLSRQPTAQRGRHPGIETDRAPFVVGGALVLATLMAHFGLDDCLVSESDILDGLASTLLPSGRAGPGPGPGQRPGQQRGASRASEPAR